MVNYGSVSVYFWFGLFKVGNFVSELTNSSSKFLLIVSAVLKSVFMYMFMYTFNQKERFIVGFWLWISK